MFGLANQYSNMISLFSFTPPAGDKVSEVTISPRPGLYPAAIQLSFAAANASDKIYFRIGSSAWIAWSNTLVARLFTNGLVQYYGQPLGNAAKSAIKSAAYAFTQSPSTLDSDGDGVPDYVELARGLNPNAGRDSDGDGYSDLEELIHGTNPTNSTSAPTNFLRLDDQAAFDLAITPRPWDGFSNGVTLSATGTVIRAYDFQGSLLSVNATTNPPLPVARLTNIAIVAEDRLVAQATELHYFILTTNADAKVGREMIGLSPVPPLTLPPVPYTYGGASITDEANNWINAASNAFKNLPRAVVANSLTVGDTLESLLFELKVAQLLGARGSNWWTNLTLFPFRVSDAGRTNPSQTTLLSLERQTTNQPGYKLQAMFATIHNLVENDLSPDIASLRQVVQDIYRINSLLNNTNPATFASPVDELRYFLWNGTLESNYLSWATSSNVFASATSGAVSILAAVSPRPTTNVFLVVRTDTLGGPCRLLDLMSGGPTFALLDSGGLAFGLPNNFSLLPGSLVELSGYTDVTNPSCAYPAIEVTSALLCSVPIATDADGDGNLLIDTWEKKFYGRLGLANPFADDDGDGYSNLQEMLEGSDP
ncbi:MAG TPA: thrombospondin type 3 repeat-containing protein, partial [Candidatus Binatia bacterium]|nr:thrombospondin type 3 repeat-containing protein [Candidatus Binatia bacterium]